ncbi:hypothetical protein M9H77_30546 [Catharanthus roseus]|uniref:Uncharacterized protein n=1 Tax=Catharanthus roseus TaxID=4058 RepID=A0ACB9ZYE8_CATRO|nr:hypothetical protein M9H77_30546 [Catharanthus roseus]
MRDEDSSPHANFGVRDDLSQNFQESFQTLGTQDGGRGRRGVSPTTGCRLHPAVNGRVPLVEENKETSLSMMVVLAKELFEGVNVIMMYGIKNYQREYDEYHEGYDHGAHTHEGYNFGAYYRNDSDEGRGVEGRRSIEKEVGHILEDLSISLSLNPSSLCYEVSLEELKSLLDSYTFQMISLVELNIVSFVLEFDRNPLQHVCTVTSMRGRRHTIEFEGQGKNVGGKLLLCYEDLTMSFSSKLFLFYFVFSFKELKLFLELNSFYEERVHCLVWIFCGDFHSKFKGEFVENCDYESPFLYASKKNLVGFISSIKLLCLESYKFEFPHEEQKELCYLWNSYGIGTLVNKLDALFSYSLQSLECFGNIHSTVPFNASISNVVRLLWLFEGLVSRTNPFKGGADDMTRDRHENMESFQGSVTRSRAWKIE